MKTKNVFISHHSKDDEHIKKLKNLLKPKGYEFKNSSIDSTKPNNATSQSYIESILRPRISWASTCIVLIGKDTHSRPYVNWEIEQAEKQGKRIIGIFTQGNTEVTPPPALELFGNACVAWNSKSIIDAIEGKDTKGIWQNPDGTTRADSSCERSVC